MTSNIEKLNLIAPQLAGRKIYVIGEERNSIYNLFGLFHSFEIDNVYPDSEPMAYFRATEAKKRYSALTEGGAWERTWETIGDDELVFPVSQLESIEQSRGECLITVQFFQRGTAEETTLCFARL